MLLSLVCSVFSTVWSGLSLLLSLICSGLRLLLLRKRLQLLRRQRMVIVGGQPLRFVLLLGVLRRQQLLGLCLLLLLLLLPLLLEARGHAGKPWRDAEGMAAKHHGAARLSVLLLFILSLLQTLRRNQVSVCSCLREGR